jgi:aspartyl-tRNA(Asn)/glutamyl-tRNA(Gln) amidotransferase subunit A
MQSLLTLARELNEGLVTSRHLVEQSLQRIADVDGEGARAFLHVDTEGARAAADYQDGLRKRGFAPSLFAGIPFSAKDLFDLAGQVTAAGSKVLQNAEPAKCDAPAIAALKAAGFVVLGRTNMTEFAYSGIGANPHFGTPRSTYQRAIGRVPGGSSSGAAVAVADGMCALSIGSDTGGSCRVPAAFNGIVGFKPSAGRISTLGAFPLSSSFDSIGPFGNSVECCAIADAIMAGNGDSVLGDAPKRHLRVGVLNTLVLDHLEPQVAEDFAWVRAALGSAGVEIEELDFDLLKTLPSLLKCGGIVGAEAHAVHRDMLVEGAAKYDPRVASRIKMASATSASDYIILQQKRAAMVDAYKRATWCFDAIVLPTVAIIPPRFSDIELDDEYFRLNGLSLRNTYVANFLNLCAISIPMNVVGTAPTGLGIMAAHGADRQLFEIAHKFEKVIARRNS